MKQGIIDIHCHVFPDKVAQKAVDAIGAYYNINMFANGTVDDLLTAGKKAGITKFVIHSTATRVEQVEPINTFIADSAASDDSLIGFGTLHPALEDMDKEVDRIISIGLKGVKLHPEFQNFSISDSGVQEIFRALEGRLPLLIHTGDENKDTSSPEKLAAVLEKFPGLVIIGAHLGGYRKWNESMEYLVGKNLYFDTSSSLFKIDPDFALEIIRRHGVEKVLFGTDYPMWGHEEELLRFSKLKLTDAEREMILCGNAARLLGM